MKVEITFEELMLAAQVLAKCASPEWRAENDEEFIATAYEFAVEAKEFLNHKQSLPVSRPAK